MSEANPYSAPDASLDNGQDVLYSPKVLSFNGRIGRMRYLAYGVGVSMLLMFVGGAAMGLAAGAMYAEAGLSIAGFGVMGLIVIASLVITVMYGKRRFNDLNRSGWWSILLFLPYVNLLPVIYLVFFPGTHGPNNFGPEPESNSIGVLILGWMMPVLFVLGIVAAIAIPQYQSYLAGAQ
jgi:uncharacterized membrane protein YhaH (DUF805 family)